MFAFPNTILPAEADDFPSLILMQSSGLPLERDETYFNTLFEHSLDILTEDGTDVEDWLTDLDDALHSVSLHTVIDSLLFRPLESDSQYSQWYYWSVTVSWWMRKYIDPSMATQLGLTVGVPAHADDLYTAIKSYFGRAYCTSYLRKELAIFNALKLGDFETVADYVIAYENSCIILTRFGAGPTPFTALARLLDELKDASPKVAEIEGQLMFVTSSDIHEKTFTDYCKVLIGAERQG